VTEARALLDKADRSFQAAETLLREGSSDFAASRTYYGCFYIAQALLLSRACRFSSHAQVVAQYGLIFARTDELDRRFHQLLLRAFKIRQLADYQVEVAIEDETVIDLIRGGREFHKAAFDYLAKSPKRPDDGDGPP
jgi:uncharacterized protein (UPF0332 family)